MIPKRAGYVSHTKSVPLLLCLTHRLPPPMSAMLPCLSTASLALLPSVKSSILICCREARSEIDQTVLCTNTKTTFEIYAFSFLARCLAILALHLQLSGDRFHFLIKKNTLHRRRISNQTTHRNYLSLTEDTQPRIAK